MTSCATSDVLALIGDTPYDVDSARRIGLQCITVLSGGYSHSELTEAGAALVVAPVPFSPTT